MRYVSVVLSLALLGMFVGCLAQPVDSVTGAKVGPAVSLASGAATAPSVNPATGNPVVLQPTRTVDVDRVVETSKSTVDAAAPFIPSPWREMVVAAAALGAGAYHQSRVNKALVTPAPGSAGAGGST